MCRRPGAALLRRPARDRRTGREGRGDEVSDANAAYWTEKVRRNRERDADTDQRLAAAGRLAPRLWEHEDPVNGAAAVEEAVRARRTRPGERDVG